jgi:hypothetical protein
MLFPRILKTSTAPGDTQGKQIDERGHHAPTARSMSLDTQFLLAAPLSGEARRRAAAIETAHYKLNRSPGAQALCA